MGVAGVECCVVVVRCVRLSFVKAAGGAGGYWAADLAFVWALAGVSVGGWRYRALA